MPKEYCVYILTSHSRVLYVGVTSNLIRRLAQHHVATFGFAAQYRVKQLVYVERHSNVHAALAREKQIKRWRRAKKIALIESQNPKWEDWSKQW